MKKRKIKIIGLLASLGFLLAQTATAQPQCEIKGTKGTTVDLNRTAECMEDRYGFDENYLRRADKKEMAPTVEIHFDIPTPVVGEKVTGIASPKGFKNAQEDLYYTWYLLRTDPETGTPLPGETMANARRRAMGIVARGDFDPELFGITGGGGGYIVADTDDDGYFASYGGADGVGAKEAPGIPDCTLPITWPTIDHYDDDGSYVDSCGESIMFFDVDKGISRTRAITRCYDHNFGIKVYDPASGNSGSDERAGRDRVVECEHEFPSCGGFMLGDGEFNLEEEECWRLDPRNHDTDGDGTEDEADLVGLNQQQFTWKYREGDHVGVVVEGTSMIPISEGGREVAYEFEGVESMLGWFPSYQAAYAECGELLEDAVDMGDASASSTGGDGGAGGDPAAGGGGGTGGSSAVAIDLVADLDARNASQAQYDACIESISELWGDDVVGEDGALNAYYKIMWAAPGICARDDGSRSFIAGDHCSPGEHDVGFNYQEAIPVNSIGDMILEPELETHPQNPQYDAVFAGTDTERTDSITVSATTANDNVDEDFLFYRWEIGKCNADLTDCSFPAHVEFESFSEGMGVKEATFVPTPATFAPGENKVFLQAVLVQSEHPTLIGDTDPDARLFDVGAIEKVIIPVARKSVSIRFYEAQRAGNTWVQGAEICGGGGNPLYFDTCPVYAYQAIAVEAHVLGGLLVDDHRFAWELNGEKIQPPIDTGVYAGSTNPDSSLIFLPMDGFDEDLQNISVSHKRIDASDTMTDSITARSLSLNNPIAVVTAVGGATPTARWDGTTSLDIFEADPGTAVSFQATIVPDYLTINGGATLVEALEQDPLNPADDIILGDDEVHLMWYLNGDFVGPDYIAEHPELAIAVAGDTISFTLGVNDTFGNGYDLIARVEKRFDPAHAQLLEESWGILDTHTITNDTSKTIRLSFNAAMASGGLPINPTLRQYLASSISNAPHYLVFCVRLGLAMALVWFVLFGFSYAVQLNKKL